MNEIQGNLIRYVNHLHGAANVLLGPSLEGEARPCNVQTAISHILNTNSSIFKIILPYSLAMIDVNTFYFVLVYLTLKHHNCLN